VNPTGDVPEFEKCRPSCWRLASYLFSFANPPVPPDQFCVAVIGEMPTDKVAKEFYEVSKLSKYDFQPYWPEKKLKICVTGAGGFIASHLAERLKSEGHYIIGCDWKRNEHMPVRVSHLSPKLPSDHWTKDCSDLPVNKTRGTSAGGNVLR